MTVKRRWMVCGGGLLIAMIAVMYLFRADDLGLTRFDIAIGGQPEMDVLRANVKAAADSFLAKRKADLGGSSNTQSEFVVDYSKASKIRSLGYRSCFYYYCWNVYLPYSVRAQSNTMATVIVQLSDAIPGNEHDVRRFHVVRALLLDQQGRVAQTLEAR